MTRKLIIVEGPDGAGKTSFAMMLAERFNLRYVHGTYSDPVTFEWCMAQLKMDCVLDRSFISEIIYAPITGRECRINALEATLLKDFLLKHEVPIFYCTGSIKTLKERAFNRGEDYISQQQLALITISYRDYFEDCGLNVIKSEIKLDATFKR